MKYYTKSGVDITEKIETGATLFFNGVERDIEIESENKARNLRSYNYEVYSNKNDTRVHVGFAVPR